MTPELYQKLVAHYSAGTSGPATAHDTGVPESTVYFYFRGFQRARMPRGTVIHKRPKYRSHFDAPRPRYLGPQWIGKARGPVPVPGGPDWIGKPIRR